MSSFDRESFHLLQMSDSMSDSLPDLDLVVPSNSKKKKVRLKRFVLLDNRQIIGMYNLSKEKNTLLQLFLNFDSLS